MKRKREKEKKERKEGRKINKEKVLEGERKVQIN